MMTRKRIIISSLVVVVLLTVGILLLNQYSCYKEITDEKTGITYLQVDDELYTKIDYNSSSIFANNTYDRLIHLSFYHNNIKEIKKAMVFSDCIIDNKQYGCIDIGNNEKLFLNVDYKILSYFAKEDFMLPNLDINEIEQVRIQYLDDSIAAEQNKIQVITDINEMKALLDNPEQYFEENDITEVYIKYKDYIFEEWYDSKKINQMKI